MPNDFMVCIQCHTYNQTRYIKSTLDGFVGQRTQFPFVILLVDDFSQDGEQDLIKSYIHDNFDLVGNCFGSPEETDDAYIFYAQHKTNRNCFLTAFLLKYNHYGKKSKLPYLNPWRFRSKYEALCEGDDFWTDPFKLQKQVDFLEKSADYSLCFHNVFLQRNHEFVGVNNPTMQCDTDVTIEQVIVKGGAFCATLSLLYRIKDVQNLPKEVVSQYVGDYPLQIYLASIGKVYYMAECMGVYRVSSVGSWSAAQDKANNAAVIATIEKEKKLLREMNSLLGFRYNNLFQDVENRYISVKYASMGDYRMARKYLYKMHDIRNVSLKYIILIHWYAQIRAYMKRKFSKSTGC